MAGRPLNTFLVARVQLGPIGGRRFRFNSQEENVQFGFEILKTKALEIAGRPRLFGVVFRNRLLLGSHEKEYNEK